MLIIDRPELFLITSETIESVSEEEVNASYHDMETLEIANLPYPNLDIGIDGKYVFRMKAPNKEDGRFDSWEIRIQYRDNAYYDFLLNKIDKTFYSLPHASGIQDKEFLDNLPIVGEAYRRLLIVLLATKNTVKTRVENKALRLGIGTKNYWKPLYTTTISLPAATSITETSWDPRGPVRPHLRRGHIRRQRHGPKLAFIRQIWIEPAFINADENFISQRRQYNATIHLSDVRGIRCISIPTNTLST